MPHRYVVTSALPYANGDIHLGHLVEHIQTDIYVRSLRLLGHEVAHICADDTHGTPIQIKAEAQGLRPEDFVAGWYQRHTEDFRQFDIGFDFYGSTHCDENASVATAIYTALQKAGHIQTRDVEQMYCAACKRFLPDRYVRGSCPKCGTADQYGDVCESCSTTYSPSDLKDPHCALCHNPPELRSSKHYFVTLSAYAEPLREWGHSGEHLQLDVRNYVDRWLEDGLKDWDISRDGPYFGFKIPGEDDKYFYVWLDAPVGYISNTWRWCQQTGQSIDRWWRDPETRVVHIIGKDIVYFHTLFWPAMLMASGYNLPTRVHVHGMLTANGEKLSKSRGTFINARTYLRFVDPQALRYYLAAKLTSGIEDIDLNVEDFVNRVNADLMNRIVNLLSRSVQFAHKRFEGRLGVIPSDLRPLIEEIEARVPEVRDAYLRFEFTRAIRLVNEIADIGNKVLQDEKPFQVIKEDPERARDVITFAINAGKLVMALLKPVLPGMVATVESMLQIPAMTFDDARFDLENHTVGAYQRLFERIERSQVEAVITASAEENQAVDGQVAVAASAAAGPAAVEKKTSPSAKGPKPEAAAKGETGTPAMIQYDQFMNVELRAGRVLKAELVEGADKLLRLEVDVGEDKPRQIFAGIRHSVSPETLQGKIVAVVANLAPRKMRFGLSEGMVLAAGEDEKNLHVVEVPGAEPGDRIR
ncbi:MAG: methionine--tRNA ligase [Pseudomonadota bacterium]